MKEVIRQRLQNGVSIDTPSPTPARSAWRIRPPGFRPLLARRKAAWSTASASAQNEPTWHTTSLSTYNSWIRNGRTGAKALNLPLITVGGSQSGPDPAATGRRERVQPGPVRRAALQQGEPAHSAVGHGRRHHELPTVTATRPGAARRRLEHGRAEQRHGVRSGGRDASADRAHRLGPLRGRSPATTAAGANTIERRQRRSRRTVQTAACSRGPAHSVTARHLHRQNRNDVHRMQRSQPLSPWVPERTVGARNGARATCRIPTTPSTAHAGGELAANHQSPTMRCDHVGVFAPNTWFWVNDAGGTGVVTLHRLFRDDRPRFTGCTAVAGDGSRRERDHDQRYVVRARDRHGRRLHQDREAGHQRRLDRHHDADPELRDRRAEPRGTICADPTPNAIMRIQRLRDNGGATPATARLQLRGPQRLTITGRTCCSTRARRSSATPPGATSNVTLGGVMHYIAIDVANLAKWFRGHGAVQRRTTARRENRQRRLHRLLLGPPQQPQRGEPGDRASTAGKTS